MAASTISSKAYQDFRAERLANWRAINAPCALCGQDDIDWTGPRNAPRSFELDHILPRKTHPHLALDPGNAQPAHSRCNRAKGAGTMSPGIGELDYTW